MSHRARWHVNLVGMAALAVVALAASCTAPTPVPPMRAHEPGDPSFDLQAALDASRPGDLITVPTGLHAGNFVISRAGVTLDGDPGAALDGEGRGTVLTVAAPDVTVRDLSIHRSGASSVEGSSGILVTAEGDRARVEEVRLQHCYLGITVREATDVTIAHVRVVGAGFISGELHAVDDDGHAGAQTGPGAPARARLRGDGVWLFNTIRTTVRDSVIADARDGISLTYGSEALIEGNRILRSRYAVHDMYSTALTIRRNELRENLSGMIVMYGGPVVIRGNVIMESGSPSTGFGVLIKDAGSVSLDANVIADNRVGIHIDDAGRTGGAPATVRGNTIAVNQIGVLLFPASDPRFTGNGFVENSTQVTLGGQGSAQAVWSAGGTGNYWSDYAGFDRTGDGRGDLPYERSGRIGQLIADEPVLLALASGPGIRLLSSVGDRWGPARPLVRDPAPLTTMTSPALRGNRRATAVPLWVPGVAALTLGGWLIHRGRRVVRVDG